MSAGDSEAKAILFRDETFLAQLEAKTIELLRSYLRMIQTRCEIPKGTLVAALLRVTAAEVEENLSVEHAVKLLRDLADALESKSRSTVLQ